LIGKFEHWWTHGLISDSTYKRLNDTCPLGSSTHPSAECTQAVNVAYTEFGNIDPYSLNTPPCNATAEMKRNRRGHYVSDRLFLLKHFYVSRKGNFPRIIAEKYSFVCLFYASFLKNILTWKIGPLVGLILHKGETEWFGE